MADRTRGLRAMLGTFSFSGVNLGFSQFWDMFWAKNTENSASPEVHLHKIVKKMHTWRAGMQQATQRPEPNPPNKKMPSFGQMRKRNRKILNARSIACKMWCKKRIFMFIVKKKS